MTELPAGLAADRFRREIQTAARLQHPHICSVYDSGDTGTAEAGGLQLWFTMPYVRGESLRDRLRGELLSVSGRGRDAVRWLEGLGEGSTDELPYVGPAANRLGRIFEEAVTRYAPGLTTPGSWSCGRTRTPSSAARSRMPA